MIRIETARNTAVTFKTLKGAENRVAKDAAWAAGFDTADTAHTVEISPRWDNDAQRTLFDVQYVTWEIRQAEDVAVGSEVRVEGTTRPYGYIGHVVGVHAPTGRLEVSSVGGRFVVREDEVVTITDEPERRLDTTSSASRQHYIDTGSYLPEGDAITDLHLEDGSCCDEPDRVSLYDQEDDSAPATASSSQPTERSSVSGLATFGVIPAGYAPLHEDVWTLVVSGQGGDASLDFDTLTEALDEWRSVLDGSPLADLVVLHNGQPYADVAAYDTCTVHRDAVFSKDGPCPVCTDEEDNGTCDTCGSTLYTTDGVTVSCAGCPDRPAGVSGKAAADDLEERTVTTLRGLLERADHGPRYIDTVLTVEERAALVTALSVLEG